MRLVNVHTMELETFLPGRIPRYAILSHTWGNDEILFEDMCAVRKEIVERTGYAKIMDCCTKIRKRRPGLDYVWIDTCCIDKSSSAELSEAINSM
jgi:Heterokaryon incompatibility protein (HET)